MDLNDKFFENIINFSSNFKFEKLFTYDDKITEVFKVSYNDKFYILKINKVKSRQDFILITNLIDLLNKENFPTPKLLYSKYLNDISYFILEFIENDSKFNIFNETHIKNLINILNLFYDTSDKIKFQKNIKLEDNTNLLLFFENFSSFQNSINSKIINECLNYIKENLNINKLIISDINPENILIKNNNLYLIDFDQIKFFEVELDLAVLLINFIPISSNLEIKLNIFSNILNNLKLKNKLDIEKIINYSILFLYKKYYLSEKYKHNLDIKNSYINLILIYYRNKNFIIKEIESRINR